ncbi:GTPase Obg [Candidatus Lokiarchaeum ossiferum]|uniref:GTPase Obg n=1 Tax=Candidatus Lokiarchaeum ossiferum TaxID=2951803 RepID=A0ABY6HT91_9ARCH|nr:GTPase Obg [Candidatus Lokiarchaeum sp. B-35]
MQNSNPFEEFYRVWSAQELLDFAFSKASSKTASLPKLLPNLEKVKRKEIKRIENSVKILNEKLEKIVKSVPNLDELPDFYRRLSHLLVNNDDLRKSLGRINGIIPVIKRLEKEYRRKIGSQETAKQCAYSRTQFFGRCSSIVRKQNSILTFLEECRIKLREVPTVNLTLPSVVVAGYPNVGKSTIVGQLSTAQPQVSDYPFTTKQIYLGTFVDQYGSKYFQVIDTPGILDRPMIKRNNIEKQAILALNTIATIVLFVFDPTVASGYDVSSQIALLREIEANFAAGLDIPIKIVINKIDFATEEEISSLLAELKMNRDEVILTNAKGGENVDSVVSSLLSFFKDTDFRR